MSSVNSSVRSVVMPIKSVLDFFLEQRPFYSANRGFNERSYCTLKMSSAEAALLSQMVANLMH